LVSKSPYLDDGPQKSQGIRCTGWGSLYLFFYCDIAIFFVFFDQTCWRFSWTRSPRLTSRFPRNHLRNGAQSHLHAGGSQPQQPVAGWRRPLLRRVFCTRRHGVVHASSTAARLSAGVRRLQRPWWRGPTGAAASRHPFAQLQLSRARGSRRPTRTRQRRRGLAFPRWRE
jgi:hypothetical protein